ncbi:diadenosine tetraphosphate (Ap4A) HIT family hydrolase [Actinomycetospora succinea]|uniref:Diadenosine tetraphosphate (Ap4A) HIT family hydrolase n=1 Tax=Actinomycetospora succinea TaxID=663603 RepID=A0A4R6VMT2_9PSEU|nr:HIT family protein [Actinomycetospora succinea]TDQ65273.1 diadenosine tetraphosphate (Ap4A) HIT family hydrolase [Actinomycetospora succinea]
MGGRLSRALARRLGRGRVRERLPAEVDGECVFCRIVDGRGEASVVAESEGALAFLDLQPVTPGHVLVVPRAHAAHLADTTDADGAAVWALARRVAAGLRAAGLADGVNLLLADGAVAWQTVWHVHLHVIPRRRGDGLRLLAAWKTPGRASLDATADRLRAAVP